MSTRPADWVEALLAGAPALLTPAEVAKLLRIDVSGVRAAQRRGELPYVEVGTRRMCPRAALGDWLRARPQRLGPPHSAGRLRG